MPEPKPVEEMLVELQRNLESKKAVLAGSDGVYQFDIQGAGIFQLVVSGGEPKILVGAAESPDVTLTVERENFRRIIDREVNPALLFIRGQLKIDGNVTKALKLQALLQ